MASPISNDVELFYVWGGTSLHRRHCILASHKPFTRKQQTTTMGVVCSSLASVFAAIGNAITGLFSLIARFLIAIVNAITSVFVTICDGIGSCLCCNGHSGRRTGGRRSRRVV